MPRSRTRPAGPAGSTDPDAVVVGSGINGLVAAAELATAGWSVTLVEANDRLGGFLASDELTVPGFLHDTYSSFHPMFVAGAAHATLGDALRRHGVEYLDVEDVVTAGVSERGVVLAHRDPGRTVAAFTEDSDRAAYGEMLAEFGAWSPQLLAVMGGEPTPAALARVGLSALRRHGPAGTGRMARALAQSGRALMRERFTGWEADQLWTPWLLHAGLAPDVASGSVMARLLAAMMHRGGMPLVRGGQGRFVEAFASLFDELGVRVLLGEAVTGIVVEGGRAVGVRLGDTQIRANRAVVASVLPQHLYGTLLPAGSVPAPVVAQASRYRPGRAVMMVHVALDGPVPWADPRLAQVPALHVGNGADDAGIACAQASAGLLPARPTVVVGQQHVLDPGRVPPGKAVLALQLLETPSDPRGDAAGELDTSRGWDDVLADGYARRVLDRLAEFAPGLSDLVLGVHPITPRGFEAANRNVVHGDAYAGSAELDQNLFWRPFPGAAGHRTPVRGLWHIGAATHPGAGLNGASGHLAAQALLGSRR